MPKANPKARATAGKSVNLEDDKAHQSMGPTALERSNLCAGCGGVLKASNGHYHSARGRPVLPYCCGCAGHKKGT